MIFNNVEDGVAFRVKVVPGSARTRVVGRLGDALKVAVAAPPERGRANQAVIRLLAERLGVAKNTVKITAGETSARKTVFVSGVSAATCRSRLLADAST